MSTSKLLGKPIKNAEGYLQWTSNQSRRGSSATLRRFLRPKIKQHKFQQYELLGLK